MRRKLILALAGTAIAAASPAYADVTPTNDPCTYGYVTGAVACQGYYGGNLITGSTNSATTTAENNAINQLITNAVSQGPGYTPPYLGLDYDTVLGAVTDLNGSATLNFGSLNLSGLTIVGAHFGNNIDSDPNNITAFWLLDLGNNVTHTITLSNGQGSSNAQIFSTGTPAVPEPATWAMMLLGFGAVGFSIRRKRKTALISQFA